MYCQVAKQFVKDTKYFRDEHSMPKPHKNPNQFNPLSPDMSKLILFTVLHTFLMELVRRIFLNIMTFVLGDHFLYSHHLKV